MEVTMVFDGATGLAVVQTVQRQVPFAASKMLNRVALYFQQIQREHQEKVFTIRQPTYWKQAVKIPKGGFATKQRLQSIVMIDPKGRPDPAPKFDIWKRQEYGGTRRPIQGREKLAIPGADVPRTARGIVRKTWQPKRIPKSRKFVVDFKGGGAGLFVRMGPRHKGYTAVPAGAKYSLKQDPNVKFMYYLAESAPITAVYQWRANAARAWAMHRQWFDEEFKKALATARVRGFKGPLPA